MVSIKITDFLTTTGRVNSQKVKDNWIFKNMPELYELLNIKYPINIRMVEKLYLFLNNMETLPICKNCGSTNVKFNGLLVGYTEYCSYKCLNNSIEIKKKKANSCIEKYGVDNPYKSENIKEKIKQTNITRYSADNPAKSKEIVDKIKLTNLKRYGTDWVLSKNSKVRHSLDELHKFNFESMLASQNIKLIEWNSTKFGVVKCKCEHDHIFELNKWQLYQRISNNVIGCNVCNPLMSFTETTIENTICNLLDQHSIKYERHNRSITNNQYELDILIPDKKLIIELNGVYWHSDKFKQNNYHQIKSNALKELGYSIIYIWEDWLLHYPEIVYSIILSKLNIFDCKIYARHTKISKISTKEASIFLNKNHIQQSVSSSIAYGLFYNDELVSVMTFGKLRKALGQTTKSNTYELYRFASKLNTQVIGGASKLLKRFIIEYNPTSIISYASCDISNGEIYLKLGFNKVKQTKPSYWYIEHNSLIRHHRFSCRKDLLVKKGYDSSKTEYEILNEMKYHRIYDSGQYEFVYSNK